MERCQLWLIPQLREKLLCTELPTQTQINHCSSPSLQLWRALPLQALRCSSQRRVGGVRETLELKIPYSERPLVSFLGNSGSYTVSISICGLIICTQTKILIGHRLKWAFGRREKGPFENMLLSFKFNFKFNPSLEHLCCSPQLLASVRQLKSSQGIQVRRRILLYCFHS